MVPVKSTNLAAVGYDDETGELVVEFQNGGTYAYEGVGRQQYEDMLASSSPGSYLHRWIKGTYRHRRV